MYDSPFLKILLNTKFGTKFVLVIHKRLKMNIFSGRFTGFLLSCFLLVSLHQKSHAQDVTVSYQNFYDNLSPYGQWVSDAEYGNVWVPNTEPGFRPYATNGHWVMTDNGNMWVSDAPWGWACYHYGRWTFNPFYGWVWVPGYEWAPAWVTWRSGGGYYGWAPMAPGVSIGMSYDYPENYWVFVEPTYLYRPNVYTYYEPRHEGRYLRRTTIINETYVDNGTRATYYYGPRREVIERETHQPVQVYSVRSAGAPEQTRVGGNEVQIYRPAVNRATVTTARPTNVVRATEPIGRPREVSREYNNNRQPEFRQQTQQNNGGRFEPSRTPQSDYRNERNNRFDEPARTQPGNRNENYGREPNRQDNNRPQPQRFNQSENRQQGEPRNMQPGRQQQENRQPADQRFNRPQQQPQPMGRPQQQPQQQRMNRPQPQQQRALPNPGHREEKEGRR